LRRYLILLQVGSLALVAGCGGGSSSAPAATPASTAANVLPIVVDAGPAQNINLAYATVTVCAPGNGANCQTIDHVIVDTGSTGLRLMSSVLAPSLALQQQKDANGNPAVACAQFADGFSWGPVKVADVKLAGEQANSLPIQVIGDPAFATIPASCSSTGPARNTVQARGANGIMGIGPFRQDCGSACAQSSSPGIYYACPAAGCQPVAKPLAEQLQNPVPMFAVDNNGIAIELPAVPPAGAATVTGSLTFGVGTQSNNALGSASVIALSASSGRFTTLYNSQTLDRSFIDSGSNVLFFRDAGIPACANAAVSGFYCPLSTVSLAAVMQGANGTSVSVNFSVANAFSLVTSNPGFTAFNNLASPLAAARSFDWGLPFFYGRKVFVAIEGANTTGGAGPYVAF
jgi:hypothetical protein